jgi:signal transduction histidine kinase
VQFTCLADAEMDSFPGPLGQVITNLLLNALTHAYDEAHPEGVVEIAVEKKGTNVVIGIKDDGAGIPPSHLPRIFDPFFTTKRGQGGTGLGLHLVYNIVTQTLGGRIGCTSAVDMGTAFTLILPLTAPDRLLGDRSADVDLGPIPSRAEPTIVSEGGSA